MKWILAIALSCTSVSAAFFDNWDKDAYAWRTLVSTNSGTMTNSTYLAATKLAQMTKWTGSRSAIYRLNLFSGDQVGAFQAPIIRDAGSGLDIAAGGGTWTYSAKHGLSSPDGNYFKTGITPSSAFSSPNSGHVAIYVTTNTAAGTFQAGIGAVSQSFANNLTLTPGLQPAVGGTVSAALFSSTADSLGSANTTGFYAYVRTSSTTDYWVDNGSTTTSPLTSSGLPTVEVYVFCRNVAGTASDFCVKTLGGYSIGTTMRESSGIALSLAFKRFMASK